MKIKHVHLLQGLLSYAAINGEFRKALIQAVKVWFIQRRS